MVDSRVKIYNSGRFLNKKKKKETQKSPIHNFIYIYTH